VFPLSKAICFKLTVSSVDDIPVSAQEEQMAHEGHGESLFNIGEIYYQKKDYPKSLDWFRLGASKENADAQYKMGWMHHKGLGVTIDYKSAMEWYLKAHNNGDASATNNIGSLYDVGAGVKQDYKAALKWYLEAASKENACALYGVGMYYEKGRGVEKDVQYALEWFEKSATLGFELAKSQIKRLNNKGHHIGDRQRSRYFMCI
jgi:TPR repeat protein